MTLKQILQSNPDMAVNDGAHTWRASVLLDVLTHLDAPNLNKPYDYTGNIIRMIDSNGYIVSVPAYTIDAPSNITINTIDQAYRLGCYME